MIALLIEREGAVPALELVQVLNVRFSVLNEVVQAPHCLLLTEQISFAPVRRGFMARPRAKRSVSSQSAYHYTHPLRRGQRLLLRELAICHAAG